MNVVTLKIRQSGCDSVLVFGSNFIANRMTGLGDQNIFQMNLVIYETIAVYIIRGSHVLIASTVQHVDTQLKVICKFFQGSTYFILYNEKRLL